MILTDSTGNKYKAHFRHMLGPRGRWQTECAIHKGECAVAERPCNTPDTLVGTARCSVMDCFERAIGRKIAFQRAVAVWPRSLRRELWGSYFAHCARPKSNSVKNHGNFKKKDKTNDTSHRSSTSQGT